jgi:hypothetical protein
MHTSILMPQTITKKRYIHRAVARFTPKVICSFPKLEKLRIKITEHAQIQSCFWAVKQSHYPSPRSRYLCMD